MDKHFFHNVTLSYYIISAPACQAVFPEKSNKNQGFSALIRRCQPLRSVLPAQHIVAVLLAGLQPPAPVLHQNASGAVSHRLMDHSGQKSVKILRPAPVYRQLCHAAESHSPLVQHIYEKDGKPYIDPRLCADEKYILAYPSQRVRQVTDQILARAGVTPDITFMTSSVETAMRVASVGIGITLMPQSYISLFTCPAAPYFCHLEDSYEAWWTFVAAYPKDSELSKPAAEMVRILKEIYT